jgi:hypothetical protein
MEITFQDMREADQILIRTQNSEYRFSVVDPTQRRGVLSGGSLGDQKRDVIVAGSLVGSNTFGSDPSGLKTGARALFYLTAKNGVERLITSIITELRRITTRGDSKRAA